MFKDLVDSFRMWSYKTAFRGSNSPSFFLQRFIREEEMGSSGASWADQWDNGPDPVFGSNESKKKSNNNALGKTKAVASSGVKKLKEGTSLGFQWIKTKYHKTTHKN
ncbi:unnamed protein product [Sphenostylis stenocarpa]|uniref:Uncharacterized protein n=1 Tax=Sphenostylis stenocarpa TaxID=92480 RepID=A0AA86W0S7_9FABA|nr:unnamed protein product [Sphenostylis stenocarpa]